MGVVQKNMFVLSKMLYTSKKSGNVSCKVTYFDPQNYITSKKDSKFEGFIVNDLYTDSSLFSKIKVGQENTFDYGLGEYGTQLKVIDVLG